MIRWSIPWLFTYKCSWKQGLWWLQIFQLSTTGSGQLPTTLFLFVDMLVNIFRKAQIPSSSGAFKQINHYLTNQTRSWTNQKNCKSLKNCNMGFNFLSVITDTSNSQMGMWTVIISKKKRQRGEIWRWLGMLQRPDTKSSFLKVSW